MSERGDEAVGNPVTYILESRIRLSTGLSNIKISYFPPECQNLVMRRLAILLRGI